MIDPAKEELFPLSELRRRLPVPMDPKRRRPHYNTVIEWVRVGRWNKSRTELVRLETRASTRCRYNTSLEAWQRFEQAINEENGQT
mgnify:CR=1 FL=1